MSPPASSNDGRGSHLLRWLHLHRLACEIGTYGRSLRVALVVGTLLNLINQPEALLGLVWFDSGSGIDLNVSKAILTYAVPFLVATYGAMTALESRPADSGDKTTAGQSGE